MTESLHTLKERNVKRLSYAGRLPFYYVERAVISVSAGHISISSRGAVGEVFPAAAVSLLMIGPGCSISTEAVKKISARGCVVCFSGGGGIPFFTNIQGYRSPKTKIRQFSQVMNPESRLKIAVYLMTKRNEIIDRYTSLPLLKMDDTSSIKALLLCEARWQKEAYRTMTNKYGIRHWSKQGDEASPHSPLSLLNHFAYAVAGSACLHLGLDPNLGFIHGHNRGGGLIFDVADVFKPALSLELSFKSLANGDSVNTMKRQFIRLLREKHFNKQVVGVLEEIRGAE